MARVEVEPGVEIYYEAQGKGSPLVFVHEFAGSHQSWAEQVEAFRSTHQTIVYDCRGYPPSSVPEGLADG